MADRCRPTFRYRRFTDIYRKNAVYRPLHCWALNSTGTLIQTTTTEAPQYADVLHRAGRSQEDQLLHQGCRRADLWGRQDRSDAQRAGHLDADATSPMDGSNG